jgi:hypothetical protein
MKLVKALTVCCFVIPSALSHSTDALAEEEDCFVSQDWLPTTPDTLDNQPEDPLSDCSAYQWSWQTFLFVTSRSTSKAAPAFLSYDTMESVFGQQKIANFARSKNNLLKLAPRVPEVPDPLLGEGILQAGLRGILVDQNNNPVYYSVYMDKTFSDFVRKNELNQCEKLEAAKESLMFEKGSLELKASWQIVDDPSKFSDFITVDAQVPTLKKVVEGGKESIVIDADAPRDVKVALLGLHVVGVIENHPEFIWASFEKKGLAPFSTGNPPIDPETVINTNDFVLYKGGTKARDANPNPQSMIYVLDETNQKIVPVTSIYRLFPFSNATAAEPDGGVVSINGSATKLFDAKAKGDVRKNYELVGAVWLKNGAKDFALNDIFDDERAAGERHMSNMSMESFTQSAAPSCFSCHRTTSGSGLKAKLINVSHLPKTFFAASCIK